MKAQPTMFKWKLNLVYIKIFSTCMYYRLYVIFFVKMMPVDMFERRINAQLTKGCQSCLLIIAYTLLEEFSV